MFAKKFAAILIAFGMVVFVSQDAFAQISVTPAGGQVGLGGSINVTNGTGNNTAVTACVAGSEIPLGLLPPGGSGSWPIPNNPALIGLALEVKVSDASGLLLTVPFLVVDEPVDPDGGGGPGGDDLIDWRDLLLFLGGY